jgi:hypothetical protein
MLSRYKMSQKIRREFPVSQFQAQQEFINLLRKLGLLVTLHSKYAKKQCIYRTKTKLNGVHVRTHKTEFTETLFQYFLLEQR